MSLAGKSVMITGAASGIGILASQHHVRRVQGFA